MTDGNIEVSEVVFMWDSVNSRNPVCSCHRQLRFSGLSQQPHPRTQESEGFRGWSRKLDGTCAHGSATRRSVSLMMRLGRDISSCVLAAEGDDDVWECGVAWWRTKIRVGWCSLV